MYRTMNLIDIEIVTLELLILYIVSTKKVNLFIVRRYLNDKLNNMSVIDMYQIHVKHKTMHFFYINLFFDTFSF